jgi:O-antigen/teichoic acid export membrane protein
VARGSTLNLAGAGFSGATTVVITILVTRHFNKPLAGAFFAAISVYLIVKTAASLGSYVGLVNFIAGLRALGQEQRVPAILRAATLPVAAVSVVSAGIMLAGAGPLARLVLSGHAGHTDARVALMTSALRVLAVALPFGALLDTLLGASRGYRDMRPSVVIDRLGRSALQVIGVGVAVAAGSASLLAPLWVLPYVPAAALAWLAFRRVRHRAARRGLDVSAPASLPGRRRNVLASRQLARANMAGFWRYTAPRAIAALAQITIQRLDIVLVAILRGPAAAAVYTAATRFLVAGQFTNSAISLAAQPRFAELFAIGDRRGANEVYQATTSWLMLLTWPMYLLAMLFGPAVLTVFGHSYTAGGKVMVILAGAMLLATACGQVDMVLIASGRSSWSLANGLMAVALNVGLDLLLIPRYGITGAAIGWAVAISVTNVVPLAQLAVAVRVHPFGRGTLAAFALPTVTLGALPLAARAIWGTGTLVSLASVAAGCALLVTAVWRFRGMLHLPGLTSLARATRKARPPSLSALAAQGRRQPERHRRRAGAPGRQPGPPRPEVAPGRGGRVTLPRPRTPSDQGRREMTSDRGRGGDMPSDQGRASTTSDQGRASTTSDQGRASTTSDQGRASTTSDRGRPETIGDQGEGRMTSDQGRASTTSDQGRPEMISDQGLGQK